MSNDFYNPKNKPVEFSQSRASRIAAELDLIQSGFGSLPDRNSIAGDIQVVASEASTSAANAYVLTGEYPITAYKKGVHVEFFCEHTNTGESTVNVDENGVQEIKNLDGTALVGAEMVASRPIDLIHDGTRFLLKNSALRLTALVYLNEAVGPQSFQINKVIRDLILPEASGGSGPYTYLATGLPAGLAFAVLTRIISGTPTSLGSSTVTYTVTDANANSFPTTFQVRVVTAVLTIPEYDDRDMVEGNRYDITLPEASGGTTPYVYTLTGLPSGLSFDPDSRLLSGSPRENGTFILSYGVEDSGATVQTAIELFSLIISSANALELGTPVDRNFTPNTEITEFVLPSASGGRRPYSYIVTGLPSGLIFDPETREVSGTTEASETAPVTYRVRDDRGTTVDIIFNIEVQVVGHRWTAVVDDSGPVTASEISAGVSHLPSATKLALPNWAGSKYLVVSQPADLDDFTSISLAGLGNSLNDFTKAAYAVTIEGVRYELWISNDDQGDVISGEILAVAP